MDGRVFLLSTFLFAAAAFVVVVVSSLERKVM
jgi:hypothetical protein